MLLQNNYINNCVTNSLKQKEEKNHAKQLHMVKKQRRETGCECLTGVHTQNIPYLPTVTTQQGKTKARKALIDEDKGAQAPKTHANDG